MREKVNIYYYKGINSDLELNKRLIHKVDVVKNRTYLKSSYSEVVYSIKVNLLKELFFIECTKGSTYLYCIGEASIQMLGELNKRHIKYLDAEIRKIEKVKEKIMNNGIDAVIHY